MRADRPILISVMQFEEELNSGRRTVFDVIEMAHRLGADGVELRRETWPHLEEELAAARQRSEGRGLLVTYATHATLFARQGDELQTLREDVDTAQTLGASQLRVFSGQIPDADDDAAWDVAHDTLDYAAKRNVVLALENYARTPGNRLAQIQQVLARLQTPALRTNIDIGNYWRNDEDVVAAIRTLGDRAVSAHIKDQTADPADPPTVLGAGVIPLDAILDELDRLPQRILYCFEFRGGDDPEGRIEQSLAYMRQRRG